MLIPATGRQGELKRRTLVGMRCRPQTAVVLLNNRAADRQGPKCSSCRISRVQSSCSRISTDYA